VSPVVLATSAIIHHSQHQVALGVTEICQLVTANGRAWTPSPIDPGRIFSERRAVRPRGDAGAALARELGMVCRVQVSAQAEPAAYTVRLAGRLTAVQLDERLRAGASRRLCSMSPIATHSTPHCFTPRLAAGGAELVGVADRLHRMTGPL
jgi:hypothetical protein